MSDSSILVSGVGEKLQTYKNRIGGENVHSEAVTLTNAAGNDIGLLPTREWGAFYNLRGQRFIATTGYVICNVNAAVPMALLQNPTGSGKWMFIDQSEFGSDTDALFSRFGGGTAGSLGTARPVGDTSGGSGTSIAKLYIGGSTGAQYAITAAGTLRKVATMQNHQTYQLLNMAGKAIVRPGQQIYWETSENSVGVGSTYRVFIDLEWVEIAEAEALAMVTAAQAHADA